MRGKIALSSDSSAGDPALLDAVDRALLLFKKTAPEVAGRARAVFVASRLHRRISRTRALVPESIPHATVCSGAFYLKPYPPGTT